MSKRIIRVGLPKSTGAFPGVVERLDAPALVSAMSLWDQARGRFRAPGEAICDLDVSLDSAGFVVMNLFGHYPWTVAQYVELAGLRSWTWWASMDFCCEPEIADSHDEVISRVWNTGYYLGWCRKQVDAWRRAGADWLSYPMPVLQGWHPEDYRASVELTEMWLDGDWPDLIGVGSVCRRPLDGPTGLHAVLEGIEDRLPAHTKVHLFGVKGSALRGLPSWVTSVDSLAWDYRARRAKGDERRALMQETGCSLKEATRLLPMDNEHRIQWLKNWLERHR